MNHQWKINAFYSIEMQLSISVLAHNSLDKFCAMWYPLYSGIEMNPRKQSESRPESSLREEYQDQGLRILGRMIARDLAKRHLRTKAKADPTMLDSSISKDDGESVFGTGRSNPA